MPWDINSLSNPALNPYLDENGAASSGLWNALTGTVSDWQRRVQNTDLVMSVEQAGGNQAAQQAAVAEQNNFIDKFWPAQDPFTTAGNTASDWVKEKFSLPDVAVTTTTLLLLGIVIVVLLALGLVKR